MLYELCELVTEYCSESRMRSRTSRGVSEWSRGKNLYMGSHILGSGKRCSFFGIVPGSFQKIPEDSGGVRMSTSRSTTSQGLAWAKGRRPGLIGPGAPSPQKPTQLGKEKRESPSRNRIGLWSPSPRVYYSRLLFMWHYSFYSKPLHIYK